MSRLIDLNVSRNSGLGGLSIGGGSGSGITGPTGPSGASTNTGATGSLLFYNRRMYAGIQTIGEFTGGNIVPLITSNMSSVSDIASNISFGLNFVNTGAAYRFREDFAGPTGFYDLEYDVELAMPTNDSLHIFFYIAKNDSPILSSSAIAGNMQDATRPQTVTAAQKSVYLQPGDSISLYAGSDYASTGSMYSQTFKAKGA